MIQPYNDRVVRRESAQVPPLPPPCFQKETYTVEQEIMEKGGRVKRVSEEKGRDEMQGTQAASIMWFGAEAICTYCSP